MNSRQRHLYRDRCDIYKVTDLSVPSYQDVACLLERKSFHKYGTVFSELQLNEDKWYFPISQLIEENWVICLKTLGHPEKDQRWLIRGNPVGRLGKIGHWEVKAERHFIFPSPLCN